MGTAPRHRRRGPHRFVPASALQPSLAHQPLDGAARYPNTFSFHLQPDLVGTIGLPVGMPDTLDISHELLVSLGSGAAQLRIGLVRYVPPLTRWGHLQ